MLFAYIACHVAVMIFVGVHGDRRDMAAGMALTGQFGLEHVFADVMPVCALVYLISSLMFLYFSVKDTGAWLGILSAVLAVLAVAAYFGLISHERGQGFAVNYHHWSTTIFYAQLAILGWFTHDRITRTV